MKEMRLKGGLLEMIGDLSEIEVSDDPINGEELKELASVLTTWATGPTFAADCHLSGLAQTETRDVIAELCRHAEQGVPVRL